MLRSPFFYVVYLVLIVLLMCEGGTRVFFAMQIGPRVLLYGTDWYRNVSPGEDEARLNRTRSEPGFRKGLAAHKQAESRDDSVERHGQNLGGYTKFFPHEKKSTRDVDTGERIPVSINSKGFRGPEFEQQKPPGVIRVLTLGASSTFGFYDRDDETYPHYMQEILNAKCGGQPRFEVINFAIPHASSADIAAMFLAEGVALEPDAVTFYQGRNDSTLPKSYDSLAEKAYSVLVHRLMLVAFLDQALVGNRVSLTNPSERLEAHTKFRSEFYLGNLTRILEASRKHHFRFIVASQQATAKAPYPRPEAERLPLHGVTYQDEVNSIEHKREKGEELTAFEYSLLVHSALMHDLRAWATKNDVTFVDVVAALDQDRDLLLSWVHLHPKANRVVAAALAQPILQSFCPDAQSRAPQ